MGWGHGGSSASRMNYADCVEALKTARNKDAGKPLTGNVRVFERHGHYAVQHYRTEIVRYYEDGSLEICTGWTSDTTISAIHALTGIAVYNRDLPLFNKRKSDTLRYHSIGGVVFNGVGGYIRIEPNGMVDMTTVKPIDVEIITDTKPIRALQAHTKLIDMQLRLRAKLGVPARDYNSKLWLDGQLHRRLEDIDYDGAPSTLASAGLTPMWFAQQAGATETVKFKEFA